VVPERRPLGLKAPTVSSGRGWERIIADKFQDVLNAPKN
jgi:hypothetical protein